MDLVTSSATEIAAQVRARERSPAEVHDVFADRVAAREPQVQAWVDRRHVRAVPIAVDGALAGVPVGVKDIVATEDLPTQMGSAAFAGHRPERDAAVVAALRRAGGVVPGKTVTTEFGIRAARETRNPHDLERTPGGSSSGSAAAVADGMVPVAIGTQTTGSIARPAAYCGVFGLKPTFGAVPRDGVLLHSPTLDTVGFLARHARDLHLLVDVTATRDTVRPPVPIGDRRIRLAFVRTPFWDLLEPSTGTALTAAVDGLPTDRFDVVERELPAALAATFEAHRVVHHVETAHHIGPYRDRHADTVTAATIDVVDEGRSHDERTYETALATLAAGRDAVGALFDGEVDAVVAACVTGEAPRGTAATGDARLNRVWSAAATPCLAVPGLRGPAGLPLGVQVVGRRGEDHHLIDVAELLARAFGHDAAALPREAVSANGPEERHR